jgi:hypothetical protein
MGRSGIELKTFERILIKLVIIQFAFLFITQLFFHQLNVLPELKVITQYEGVVREKNTESVETIWENQKAGK